MMWEGPELLESHHAHATRIGGAHGIWWARLVAFLVAVLFLVLAMTASANDQHHVFVAASGPSTAQTIATDP